MSRLARETAEEQAWASTTVASPSPSASLWSGQVGVGGYYYHPMAVVPSYPPNQGTYSWPPQSSGPPGCWTYQLGLARMSSWMGLL